MSSVPSPRNFRFSAARYRSTFYWGGATWDWAKRKYAPVTDLEYLYELEVVGDKWKKHLLKGQHPPGVYSGACAVVGDCLYLYGGYDKKGKLTGSLFELNLSTKSWRELSRPGTGGPKKKLSCGMVAYNSTLLIYGRQADDSDTNELHMFDVKADQSINGSVFEDLKKEDIDVLGFNFGACKILLKVLKQIKEHQTAQVTSRTELDSNHFSEICSQLVSVKHQWEEIALALGFKDHDIKNIKRDVSLQLSGNQLYEVISFWLRWGPKDKRGSKDIATLEALQVALNQTNNARVKLKLTMNSAKQ